MKLESLGFGIGIFFISIPVHSKVFSTVWGNVAHGKHGLIEKAGDMKHISSFTAWVALDQKPRNSKSWSLHLQNKDSLFIPIGTFESQQRVSESTLQMMIL